jgi:hypothetical protein
MDRDLETNSCAVRLKFSKSMVTTKVLSIYTAECANSKHAGKDQSGHPIHTIISIIFCRNAMLENQNYPPDA